MHILNLAVSDHLYFSNNEKFRACEILTVATFGLVGAAAIGGFFYVGGATAAVTSCSFIVQLIQTSALFQQLVSVAFSTIDWASEKPTNSFVFGSCFGFIGVMSYSNWPGLCRVSRVFWKYRDTVSKRSIFKDIVNHLPTYMAFPILEECVFRGCLQNGLKWLQGVLFQVLIQRGLSAHPVVWITSPLVRMALTSACFGAAHLGESEARKHVVYLGVSTFFVECSLYEITGSLWASTGAHMVHNLVACTLNAWIDATRKAVRDQRSISTRLKNRIFTLMS